MSEGLTVECHVCETAFDPTAAGGWCTNPECGEWKYDGDAVPDPQADIEDGVPANDEQLDSEFTSSGIVDPGTDYPEVADDHDQIDDSTAAAESADWAASEEATTPASGDDEEASDVGAADYEDGGKADDAAADTDERDEVDEATTGADETDSVDESVTDADAVSDVADEDGTVGDDGASEADAQESGGGEATSEADGQATDNEIFCPGCDETLDAGTNFCPNCGVDVSVVGPDDELTACPSCGDDVDPDDNFCANCGENLEEHRGQPSLTECPDCGAAIEDDESFCADCGENLDEHRASGAADASTDDESDSTAGQPPETAPVSLRLTTRGREIAVTDGETVGRELREIITETGGDENDAVRIHREHIRIVREGGQFYLVDLGENPTEVNGTALTKGDREQISPGDEITLSDVATLTVAHP